MRTPNTAIEPGARNRASELAFNELRRLELDGRIVFDETFFAVILGGINSMYLLVKFYILGPIKDLQI